MNSKLQETHPGCKIGTLLFIDGRVTVAIQMEDAPSPGKGKRRIKAPQAVPTYCPFCGEKYKTQVKQPIPGEPAPAWTPSEATPDEVTSQRQNTESGTVVRIA
jgi:hypothetical protein